MSGLRRPARGLEPWLVTCACKSGLGDVMLYLVFDGLYADKLAIH